MRTFSRIPVNRPSTVTRLYCSYSWRSQLPLLAFCSPQIWSITTTTAVYVTRPRVAHCVYTRSSFDHPLIEARVLFMAMSFERIPPLAPRIMSSSLSLSLEEKRREMADEQGELWVVTVVGKSGNRWSRERWCVLSAIATCPLANVRLPIHRSTLNEPSDRYPRRLLPFPVV